MTPNEIEMLIMYLEKTWPKPEHRNISTSFGVPEREERCQDNRWGCGSDEECCGSCTKDCDDCVLWLGAQKEIAKLKEALK